MPAMWWMKPSESAVNETERTSVNGMKVVHAGRPAGQDGWLLSHPRAGCQADVALVTLGTYPRWFLDRMVADFNCLTEETEHVGCRCFPRWKKVVVVLSISVV